MRWCLGVGRKGLLVVANGSSKGGGSGWYYVRGCGKVMLGVLVVSCLVGLRG